MRAVTAAAATEPDLAQEEQVPLIQTFEHLEAYATRWENHTEQGRKWANNCTPLSTFKEQEMASHTHENRTNPDWVPPIELQVDLENPPTERASLHDQGMMHKAPRTHGTPAATTQAVMQTAPAATTTDTTMTGNTQHSAPDEQDFLQLKAKYGFALRWSTQGQDGKRHLVLGNTKRPRCALIRQKAADGFPLWWSARGRDGQWQLVLDEDKQPRCGYCGIQSHNRASCPYLREM